MNKSFALRISAAAFGVAMLTAAGGAAAFADPVGDGDVDITVDIAPIEEPGVLALTVAANETALTEDGSTELVRQFTGTLPTVTVTDTRSAEEIPDGAFWAVLGTASDFVSQSVPAGSSIGAEHLGWSPSLVQGDGEAFVSVGEEIDTVLDGGEPGLVDQELLFLADSGPSADAGGVWSATADLFLRVPATVQPGAYTSVLTLSLFE